MVHAGGLLLRPPRNHKGLTRGDLPKVPRALHEAIGKGQNSGLARAAQHRPRVQSTPTYVSEGIVRGQRTLPRENMRATMDKWMAGIQKRAADKTQGTVQSRLGTLVAQGTRHHRLCLTPGTAA